MAFLTGCGPILEKSAIAVIVLFILARLMGKKQISQLTYFDYIVGISIGSVAASLSVDRRISLGAGIFSMLVWALFPIVFSYLAMHSMFARRLLDGVPTLLVQNGKIIEKNLKRSRLTVNDLLEELRGKDIFNLAEVDFAVLETSGKLSVVKKAPGQAGGGLFANVIVDGKFMEQNMAQIGVSRAWLENELRKNSISSVRDVLLACCDNQKTLHIDKKKQDPGDFRGFQ